MKIPNGYVFIPVKEAGMGFRAMIKNDLTIVAESSLLFQKEQMANSNLTLLQATVKQF